MISTVVLAGGPGERLLPLTLDRNKAAVPFGGKYRLIDFTLSNCLHSDLRQIYVLTQYKSQSLSEHIKKGWNLYSHLSNDFISSVPAQQQIGKEWYKGTADAIRQNLYRIIETRPNHVLILSGDHVYKMDYRLMIKFHEENDADLTIAAIEVPKETAAGNLGVMEVDKDNRLIGFEEKPPEPKTILDSDKVLASMGVYLFRTDTLASNLNGVGDDFGKVIIPTMVGKHKIFVYDYTKMNKIEDYITEIREDGIRKKILVDRVKDSSYWRDVGNIKPYHDAHMDLVGVDPALDLYGEKWPLMTLPKYYPPGKSIFGGTAPDSLVSDGCIISGGTVVRSVLSPGVTVERGALVEESVLFDNVQIGKNVRIKRAIVDKDVEILPGTNIGYDLEEDLKRIGKQLTGRCSEMEMIAIANNIRESGIVVIPKGLRMG